jgi:hypothetical protein
LQAKFRKLAENNNPDLPEYDKVFNKKMEKITFSNINCGSRVDEENLSKYTKDKELIEITAL